MAPEPSFSERDTSPTVRGAPKGSSTERSRAHTVKTLDARAVWLVSGRTDERIAAIAARQRGIVGRRQLLAAGISHAAITRRVARGSLHPVFAGVYAVGHGALLELGRETAALLACRDGTVLSHETAAPLWRIRPVQATDAPIHVTSLGTQTSRADGIIAHRTCHLLARDIRIQHRLPVTSAPRTLLDLAEILALSDLEWALDDALARRIVSPAQIKDVIDRLPGRAGAAVLKALMEARRGSGITRSKVERRFLALVRAAGLPDPDRNLSMHGYNVDFYWRDERVAVEVDTYGTHGTKSAFERDRRKDATLRNAGVAVARFTDLQIDNQSLAVIASVTQMLALARPGRQPAPMAT